MSIEKFAERFQTNPIELRKWLVEAMVLGAVSDGAFDARETEAVLGVIRRAPEFAGMDSAELRSILENCVDAILHDGFNVRIHALAGALPRYANRVFAFRAAAFVAFANGKLENDELSLLKQLQKTLGITEADVAQAIEDVQAGGGTAPDEVEPVDAYLDCLLMAAAADRELRDEELATVIAFVITRQEFAGLDEDHLHDFIQQRLGQFARGGSASRLGTIAGELPSVEHRENAYGLAVAMCVSDQELAPSESAFLADLADALDLSLEQIENLQARLTRE